MCEASSGIHAATVWDPHTTENIKKVESVRRRAARFVTGDYRYTSSVTAMTESPPTQKTASQGHSSSQAKGTNSTSFLTHGTKWS